MATPDALASRIVFRRTEGSPPWKPAAMLADVIAFISPRSCPMEYAPNDSPTSAFRSTRMSER
jgi:hypothetical protein